MHTHTHTRQYYLSDIPFSEALQKFHEALEQVGALTRAEAETLALDQAHGRVTASPVWAVRSSPHYDAAAMDGVAVRARETIGATETSPLRLTVDEQAVWVDTGDPMPAGFDAVIMIEVIHEVDASTIGFRPRSRPTSTCVLWEKTSWRRSWCCRRAIASGHRISPPVRRLGSPPWRCVSRRTWPSPHWHGTRPHRHRAQAGPHHRVQLPHAWRHDCGLGWQSDTLALRP